MSALAVHLRPNSNSGAANAKVPGAAIVFVDCNKRGKQVTVGTGSSLARTDCWYMRIFFSARSMLPKPSVVRLTSIQRAGSLEV